MQAYASLSVKQFDKHAREHSHGNWVLRDFCDREVQGKLKKKMLKMFFQFDCKQTWKSASDGD